MKFQIVCAGFLFYSSPYHGLILIQIVIILALIVANGFLAMAEIAVISARKARLQQRADEGDPGAKVALELANSPGRFLSTIQIGITLVGILAGAFGGAIIAEQMAPQLNRMDWIAPHGGAVSLFIVVLGITYLSLIIGELVPKQIALNHAERISAAVAPFMRGFQLTSDYTRMCEQNLNIYWILSPVNKRARRRQTV